MPQAELEKASAPPENPSSISVDGGAPFVLAMAGWYWKRKNKKKKKKRKDEICLCSQGLQYKPLNYSVLEISIARSGSTVH